MVWVCAELHSHDLQAVPLVECLVGSAARQCALLVELLGRDDDPITVDGAVAVEPEGLDFHRGGVDARTGRVLDVAVDQRVDDRELGRILDLARVACGAVDGALECRDGVVVRLERAPVASDTAEVYRDALGRPGLVGGGLRLQHDVLRRVPIRLLDAEDAIDHFREEEPLEAR